MSCCGSGVARIFKGSAAKRGASQTTGDRDPLVAQGSATNAPAPMMAPQAPFVDAAPQEVEAAPSNEVPAIGVAPPAPTEVAAESMPTSAPVEADTVAAPLDAFAEVTAQQPPEPAPWQPPAYATSVPPEPTQPSQLLSQPAEPSRPSMIQRPQSSGLSPRMPAAAALLSTGADGMLRPGLTPKSANRIESKLEAEKHISANEDLIRMLAELTADLQRSNIIGPISPNSQARTQAAQAAPGGPR